MFANLNCTEVTRGVCLEGIVSASNLLVQPTVCFVVPDLIGHLSLEQVQQVLAVAIFGQRPGQLLQAFGIDPFLVEGDFFRAGYRSLQRTFRHLQNNKKQLPTHA